MGFARGTLLLVVLLGAAGGALAQDPFSEARPALRTYGASEDLPGDSVYEFLLDRRGQFWAGTLEGLGRFTGIRWMPGGLPPGASSQHVRALLEARDGSLWVGTQDGGVWRHKDGVWQHFDAVQGLPSNRISCLMETEEDGKAVLWVGTAGSGIGRYSEGRWSRPDRGMGLEEPWIWKLRRIRDAEGHSHLWAAGRNGLWTLRGARWERLGAAQGFRGTNANDLVEMPGEDGRPNLWVSCWELGVARWDGRRWEHFGPREGFPSRFPTSLCVTRDAQGQPLLWAGTFDLGVVWREGGAWRNFSPAKGFPVVGAYALKAVPGGRPTVWVGTRGAGVVAVDLGGWRTLDARSGLPGAEVRTFQEFTEPGGRTTFWIGTTGGVAHWTGSRWDVEDATTGMPSPYVFQLAVARDTRGRPALWAGTLGGLLRRDRGRWIREPGPLLPRTSADALLEAELKRGEPSFWVGYNSGLACLKDGAWSFFTMAEGLPGNWVLSLCSSPERDGGASLWVGTRGQGIGRYRGGRWTSYGAGSGLPALTVRGLASTRGSDGRTWMWAGTHGGGLARLEADREDARWEVVPLDVEGRTILGLARDPSGRLYISTTRGVFRCRMEERLGVPRPGQVEHFTTGDGLPSNTLQDNALYQDREGRVWVGTARGAAVLDPRLERQVLPPLPPTLEGVDAPGRTLGPGAGLIFGHRDTRLVFRYALQTFHRREDVRFRTWIEGLEGDPTPWHGEDARELTGLPAGRYTLHVWARDFAGRETVPLRVPFTILPAPWRSPWAHGFYVLAGGMGLLGVVRMRTAILRRRQRVLEARVRRALAEVKTLRGLIPICAYCKKIRDDQGAWEQMEHYLSEHSEAVFSHGVCPECREILRREMAEPPS